MSSIFKRRCTSCGEIDEREQWSSAEEAPKALDWTCARCGARETWEIVKVTPSSAA
jgi:hypothetical protein